MSVKDLLIEEFKPASKAMDAFPWQDEKRYANYLAQTFYYTNHSTRLLAVGAGRMEFEEESLHQRYFHHGVEEKGHQVMAKNDLEKLGYSISQFPEMVCTKQLYQPQYYYMHHKDPASLLGYILALEGAAWLKADDLFKITSEKHGANCSVFLKVHASHDPQHIDEAVSFVESLSKERREFIFDVMKQSIRAFELFFYEMAEADLETGAVHQAA